MVDVLIRPTMMEDLPHIMTWVNDPETVANIATIQSTITENEEYRWLYWTLQDNNERLYSIFDKTTGAYIGQCGLHKIYWPAKNARLSVIIKKEFQNYGFAYPTVMALLEKAFTELKLHKVWCIVWEDNPKTIHLYQDKVGMQQEGHLIDEYFLNGKRHNMLRLYVLEDEYRKLRGGFCPICQERSIIPEVPDCTNCGASSEVRTYWATDRLS
jgi:RimJ/RimL family protein N-acetyltransferase